MILGLIGTGVDTMGFTLAIGLWIMPPRPLEMKVYRLNNYWFEHVRKKMMNTQVPFNINLLKTKYIYNYFYISFA